MSGHEVSKLTGAELDYWVACAEGLETPKIDECGCCYVRHREFGWWTQYKPSTDWATGGPIIEREEIELHHDRGWREDGQFGRAWQGNDAASGFYDGDTPLVAAMRSYVGGKFGLYVEEIG